MPLSNRSTRSAADEERETPVDADGASGRRGRRLLRRGLLLGTAVAVAVGVLRRRRRRRAEREFTEIELDGDSDDR